MSWASRVTADGASHLWAMQETSSSGSLADSIGTANGSYDNSSSIFVQQNSPFLGIPVCIYCNGGGSAEIATATVTLGAAFTVEWIMQFVALRSGSPNGMIQAGSESNFFVRASDSGLRPGQLNGNFLTATWPTLGSGYDVTTGVPYHFAISYDGTTAKLYQNGVLINSVAVSGSVANAQLLVPYDFNYNRDSNAYLGGLALTPSVLPVSTILAHAGAALGFGLSDTFANAALVAPVTLAGPLATVQDTSTFTTEASEPLTLPVGATGWLQFTPVSGGTWQIDTVGSNYDTGLAVYTGGSVAGLTLVASDDDSGGSLTSKLTVHLAKGVTYSVQVGIGKAGVTPGIAHLNFTNLSWDGSLYKGRSTQAADAGATP